MVTVTGAAGAAPACTLILHATFGTCPTCGREVMAPEWNKTTAPGCYWCGHDAPIPTRSRCGCVGNLAQTPGATR